MWLMVVVELLEDEEDWYLGAGSHCELGGPHTASHRGQLVGLVGDGVVKELVMVMVSWLVNFGMVCVLVTVSLWTWWIGNVVLMLWF